MKNILSILAFITCIQISLKADTKYNTFPDRLVRKIINQTVFHDYTTPAMKDLLEQTRPSSPVSIDPIKEYETIIKIDIADMPINTISTILIKSPYTPLHIIGSILQGYKYQHIAFSSLLEEIHEPELYMMKKMLISGIAALDLSELSEEETEIILDLAQTLQFKLIL